MDEKLEVAYLAGIFDSTGSFSIQVMDKSSGLNFAPKMTLSTKHTPTLEWLQTRFGGKIYKNKWSLGKRAELVEVAEELLPFLDAKKEVCEKFLHALSLFPENSRKGVDLYHGKRGWTRELEFEVAEIAYSLNPGTANRIKNKQNRLNELCARYGVDATITSLEGQVNDIGT